MGVKDFDAWNEEKKQVDAREDALLYHEREVRWCRLGTNVGFEQDVSLGTVAGRPASAIVSQLRLVDTKRLDQKIATVDKKLFMGVRKAAKDML